YPAMTKGVARQLAALDQIEDQFAVALRKNVFVPDRFPAPLAEGERARSTVKLGRVGVFMKIGRVGVRVEKVHAGLLKYWLGVLRSHRVCEGDGSGDGIEFAASFLSFPQVFHRQRTLVPQKPCKHRR